MGTVKTTTQDQLYINILAEMGTKQEEEATIFYTRIASHTIGDSTE